MRGGDNLDGEGGGGGGGGGWVGERIPGEARNLIGVERLFLLSSSPAASNALWFSLLCLNRVRYP